MCEGLITRKRVTVNRCEESILDFFIVCSKILPYVLKMKIDQEKKYVLTNYNPASKGLKAIDSDHFTQFVDLKLTTKEVKHERSYFFNYKNKTERQKFKAVTSKLGMFTKCFDFDIPIEK